MISLQSNYKITKTIIAISLFWGGINNDDLIDMKNGNKNFWQLGKKDIRKKLINNIIEYIKDDTSQLQI